MIPKPSHRQEEKKIKKDKVNTEEQMGAEKRPRKKRKHKKGFIIIAVIVVALIILKVVFGSRAGAAAAVVTTVLPTRGDLQDTVSTSGTVESGEVKVIFAPVSGTIGSVNAEAGDAVKAGELLIGYDMEEMEKMLKQSSLQLARSTAVYEGVYSQSAQNQAKLNEANHNLGVLKQQITDYEVYLANLQNSLDKNQRDTANALAAENYNLSEKLKTLSPDSDEYREVSS